MTTSPFLTETELATLIADTCPLLRCLQNPRDHAPIARTMLEALPEGYGITSLDRIMTAVNPTIDAMLMAMQTPRPLDPTKAHGFIDTDPCEHGRHANGFYCETCDPPFTQGTGQSVNSEGTRVGYDGFDNYLLYLHNDDTMTLGRDVVGEWRNGCLHLSSPHTSVKAGFSSASRIAKACGPNFLALPLIERLLADPTARISIWDEA